MKLITFALGDRVHTGAIVDDETVLDLGAVEENGTDLRSVIAGPGLASLAGSAERATTTHLLEDLVMLPPITDPAKILCVGVNYKSHRDETGHSEKGYPTIFTRFADTQTGHRTAVVRPRVSDQLDYEGELAVVIGATAYQVAKADAYEYIAGYSVYNDFTVRDWQKHTTQWIPGKNFPTTGAFGPSVVTADEVDVRELVLTTRVNGEVRQHAPVADLIFDIPDLIEYVTTFTVLRPGDLIVTGTPGGVGQFMDPPSFLHDGDVVEVEIPGVGLLRNVVVAETGSTPFQDGRP